MIEADMGLQDDDIACTGLQDDDIAPHRLISRLLVYRQRYSECPKKCANIALAA